jgi:hypothetical protein
MEAANIGVKGTKKRGKRSKSPWSAARRQACERSFDRSKRRKLQHVAKQLAFQKRRFSKLGPSPTEAPLNYSQMKRYRRRHYS